MKREALFSISSAILTLALLPAVLQAQSNASAAGETSAEHAQSLRMVAAQTVFDKSLDGKGLQPGQEIQVTLVQKIKLNDGQELPKGTTLAGTVVSNGKASNGNTKLSVRFTEARVKGGKTIPVQAVVTGLYDGGSLNAQYGTNSWTPGQVNVEQSSAVSGLVLSSRVGTGDSGSFETKKDTVKIDRGHALFVAIAPGEGAGSGSANGK
jgi:hypothetical protein